MCATDKGMDTTSTLVMGCSTRRWHEGMHRMDTAASTRTRTRGLRRIWGTRRRGLCIMGVICTRRLLGIRRLLGTRHLLATRSNRNGMDMLRAQVAIIGAAAVITR